MVRRFCAIDLFAGCGGATLGLRNAGFDVIAAVEKDPQAASCYRKNHPKVNMLEGDIRKITDGEFLRQIGQNRVALVAGCPPCQGFSRIRTRNTGVSTVDPRNSLYLEFIRVVRLLKPTAIMLENVPRFAIGGRFERLCSDLRKIGYCLTSEILDVANFGVPQRRQRLLLMGVLGALPQLAVPSTNKTTVRQVFGRINSRWLQDDPLHAIPHRMSEAVRRRIAAIPKDGGGRSALSEADTLPCHRRMQGAFNDVYGRMRWDDVAPTITAGVYTPSKGRFLHPEDDRCISLREAAVLQSFPVTYKFPVELGKMKLASLIGNALPPEFIRRHAEVLLRQLNQC